MSIEVARIDERLVHGQVAYSWSVAYDVNAIMVVDDVCAKDEMQKMLINMAVPKGKKSLIFTTDEAILYFKDGKDRNEKIFIVVKSPNTYLSLVKGGVKLKSINVGGMYFKPGKKQLSKTVYVDEDDIKTFKEIESLGVESEMRTSPSDKSINLYKLI
jgi:PTS system N-acetylgalactosamine-specific IIB component/PTS system mannose-specific IIB component